MTNFRMRLGAMIVLLLTTPVFAQPAVTVKSVTVQLSTTPHNRVQVLLPAGIPFGDPVDTIGETKTLLAEPAALLLVKLDKPIEELLIKVKCATASVENLEPGAYIIQGAAGDHTVTVDVITQSPLSWEDAVVHVRIGSPIPPPIPPPPIPPPPGPLPPEPIPPEPIPPEPPPSPAPIPVAGLRVLVVYELDDIPNYEQSKVTQLFSQSFRTWLRGNCAKDAQGNTEARFLDDDTTGVESIWMTVLKRPRATLPWLVVSNGTTGHEGPLPATEAETIALIQKFK